MKKFKGFKTFLTERLKEEILRFYYIFWAASFGCGLYAGIECLQVFKVPAYIHYILIAFMFTILFGSFYFYSKIIYPERIEADKKVILFLAVIPVVIFFICGFMISNYGRDHSPAGSEEDRADIRVAVQVYGRVSSHPKLLYGSTYFDMVVRRSGYLEVSEKGSQALIENDYMANIILKGHDERSIKRDDILDIKGELHISGGDIFIKANSSNIEFLERDGAYDMVFGFRQRMYRCIERTFTHNLDYRHSPLARALILGDRTGISKHQYNAFKKSGTAHLMAISGMHISFLALIIYMILGKAVKKPLLIAFIIIILMLYNFILDTRASVMRATIWVLSAIIAGGWKREHGSSRILCISFIIMLILNPIFMDDPGFWLSFSAMAGVVFIYPVIRNMVKVLKIPEKIINNYFTGMILLTISVQITCGPLLLYYFGSLPLISPVSNLFILPFFYILIFMLFSAAFISIIWPPAGGAVLKMTPFFFRAVSGIADFFSDSVFPAVEIESIPIQRLSSYYFPILIAVFAAKILLAKRFDF
ncbi:MAG: ComEC/Rec2 family competence protein [Actinomycetia bacterium]|nr:ComEC/Rec2 family competence protein [Actinomycetes bacterium]